MNQLNLKFQSSILKTPRSLAAGRYVQATMKPLILILLFGMFTFKYSFAQELPQCVILKKASVSKCVLEYEESLQELLRFESLFPNHSLIDEVVYETGNLYHELDSTGLAKKIYYSIIDGKENNTGDELFNPLECKTSWKVDSLSCSKIVFPEEYVHLQHLSCLGLSTIFKEEGRLDSSLMYLKLANNKFEYNYYCGNGNDMKDNQLAMLYSDIYLEMNDTNSAIRELLSVMFKTLTDNSNSLNRLKVLLKSQYSDEEIKNQITQGLSNIEKIEVPSRNDKVFVKYKLNIFGETVWIPYGWKSVKIDGQRLQIETSELMEIRLRQTSAIKLLLN